MAKGDSGCDMAKDTTSSCCGTATGAACCGTKACTSPCSTATGGCCDLTKMKLKVVYFNQPARAEIIRWMLSYAKAPFEDMRVKGAEWNAIKKNYPTENLPVLEFVDPKTGKAIKLAQTGTIVRAVAGFTGLAGRTPKDAITADEAFECIRDVMESFYNSHKEKDAERKAVLEKKVKTELMPVMMAYLEKKIKENNGKCLSGNSFTYGDFAIATFVDCKRAYCTAEEMKTFEKEYPCLTTCWKTIAETNEVKEYLAKRPEAEKEC